jgi:CBS domain-containing protein
VTPVLLGDVLDGLDVGGRKDPDPVTVRPSLPAKELADRLRRQPSLRWVAVTTPDGRLRGVIDGDRVRDLAASDRLP